MVVTKVISDSPVFVNESRNKHDVNLATTVATSATKPEKINVHNESLGELGTTLQKMRDTLSQGRNHPSLDNFSSRKLLFNRFINEFQSVKTLDLNDKGLAALDLAEEVLMSTASTDSLLIGALSGSTSGTNSIDDRDICDKIRDLMDTVNEEYLSVFEDAVEKQTEYWRKFTAIQGKLAEFTSASGDNIKLEVTKLIELLEKISSIGHYQPPLSPEYNSEFVIYPEQSESTVSTTITKEEAKKWAAALGLNDDCVVEIIIIEEDGSLRFEYVVTVDLKPVQQILNELLKMQLVQGAVTMNPAKYQAWLTGFNAQTENIKTSCQTVTTKYSSANSLYDSLIKLLTSTISTLMNSNKEYLKF